MAMAEREEFLATGKIYMQIYMKSRYVAVRKKNNQIHKIHSSLKYFIGFFFATNRNVEKNWKIQHQTGIELNLKAHAKKKILGKFENSARSKDL